MMRRKCFLPVLIFILSLVCLKYYLLSPFYVMADIFYYMPKSAFDDYDGEGRKGMVWFPITRLECVLSCD